MLPHVANEDDDISITAIAPFEHLSQPYQVLTKATSSSGGTRSSKPGAKIDGAPLDRDILCGKDKSYNKHPGNMAFRALIDSYSDMYETLAESKPDKMKMTAEIVQQMRRQLGARFVKPTENGMWQEISMTNARDKVSHALRFAARTRCSAKPQELVKQKKQGASMSLATMVNVGVAHDAMPPPAARRPSFIKMNKELPLVYQQQDSMVVDPLLFMPANSTSLLPPTLVTAGAAAPPSPAKLAELRPLPRNTRRCSSVNSVDSLGSFLVRNQHELMEVLMNSMDTLDLETASDQPIEWDRHPRLDKLTRPERATSATSLTRNEMEDILQEHMNSSWASLEWTSLATAAN